MKHNYDVIIVGAGLIGASLALHLADTTELRIAVFERGSALTENPLPNQKVVALGAVATDVLRQINIFEKLDASQCHAYESMVVWDECSDGVLSFSAEQHAYQQLGHMLDSNQCCLLLHQALLASANVDAYFNANLIDLTFEQNGAIVQTQEAGFSCRLVVAADGGHSWVRHQAKIFANHQAYQQQGLVARIRTSKAHKSTAWQRFLTTGPIAVLPLAENQSSIVWSANIERSAQLIAMGRAEFEQELAIALEFKLGDIELLTELTAFPLHSQKAETYIKRNLVLLGDAAHSIHPLAGQGANLGFKDLRCLSEVLASVATDQIGDLPVLQRYQRKRKFDNEQTDQLMTSLHAMFQNNSAPIVAARGFGMNLIGRSSLMKKILLQQAIGN